MLFWEQKQHIFSLMNRPGTKGYGEKLALDRLILKI